MVVWALDLDCVGWTWKVDDGGRKDGFVTGGSVPISWVGN